MPSVIMLLTALVHVVRSMPLDSAMDLMLHSPPRMEASTESYSSLGLSSRAIRFSASFLRNPDVSRNRVSMASSTDIPAMASW